MRLLLRNLLFTFLVPGTVAGWLPYLIRRGDPPASGSVAALGLLLFALGIAIYAWCVWDFASFGRGTPAPVDAPKKLVVRGLYRFTRNPMYLGVLTVVLAWSVCFRSLPVAIYAALVACAFQLFIVAYEEPHLEQLFGDDYRAYRARVRRWLPGIPRPPG